MKLIQYTGPFGAGTGGPETINLEAKGGLRYVQIGIQRPWSEPLNRYDEVTQIPDIKINNVSYKINACDILEFADISEMKFTIEFLKPMPPEAIIDILYDESD